MGKLFVLLSLSVAVLAQDELGARKPVYKYRYETEEEMKTAASTIPLKGYHVVEGGYYPVGIGGGVGGGVGLGGVGYGGGGYGGIGLQGAGLVGAGYGGAGLGGAGIGLGGAGIGIGGYGGKIGGAGIGLAGAGLGAGGYGYGGYGGYGGGIGLGGAGIGLGGAGIGLGGAGIGLGGAGLGAGKLYGGGAGLIGGGGGAGLIGGGGAGLIGGGGAGLYGGGGAGLIGAGGAGLIGAGGAGLIGAGGAGLIGGGVGGAGLIGGGAGLVGGPLIHGVGGEVIDKNVYSGGDKKLADASYGKAYGNNGGEFNSGNAGYGKGIAAVKNSKGEAGFFNDAAGGKKLIEDGKTYYGGQQFNKQGKQGGEFSEKKGHKKGHVIKGFKSSHHKDENGKTEEYYDEENDEGGKINFSGESGSFGAKGASGFKGALENGEFAQNAQKKEGHFDNEHLIDSNNANQGGYGAKKYGANGAVYGVNNGIDQHSLLGHQENSKIYKHFPHHVPFY